MLVLAEADVLETVTNFLRQAAPVAVALLVGVPTILLLAFLAGKVVLKHFSAAAASFVRRAIAITGAALLLLLVLHLVGLRVFQLISSPGIATAIKVALVLGLGFPLLYLGAALSAQRTRKRFSDQAGMLVHKAIWYLGTIILVVIVVQQMGFQITALLGAAGIAGIAIGFASQTSVSNIISGIFLVSERPFQVGDLISVGGTRGTVLSIDLLSVKLRTLDNMLVRIPNETMIKTEVTTITRFPIRRFDIQLGVAYREDVRRVRDILGDLARKNPYVLDEPEPLVLFTGFGDSALEFLFGVWFAKDDFLALRSSLMPELKERLDAEGIEIPFPHRTLYAGSATDPFPVRVVQDAGEAGG